MDTFRHVVTLTEQGLLERALHALSGPALLPPEQRSLRVFLDSHVGDLRRSAVDAEVLLRHETEPVRVAQLKDVIGRAPADAAAPQASPKAPSTPSASSRVPRSAAP